MSELTKAPLPYTLGPVYAELNSIFDSIETDIETAQIGVDEVSNRIAVHVADATEGNAAEINALRDALIAAGLMEEE